MRSDQAECGALGARLERLGSALDRFLAFGEPDPMQRAEFWRTALGGALPAQGVGMDRLLDEFATLLIPNGSPIPRPGCTSFITTGAVSAGVLGLLAGAVAAPQRIGLTAFNHLEEVSLRWLAELFSLPAQMRGVYSSGGSVANIVALGAARQAAYERLGIDPAADGMPCAGRIYATAAAHHTIQRAAGVLGLGRNAVVLVEADSMGRMRPQALRQKLCDDAGGARVGVAVVANAGTTAAGAIDPLRELGELAQEFGVWFHVDGAYGLPGILDERVRPLYDGLQLADSVVVDPHKWLGAPVGIGATFVRDRDLLHRAFTQGASDYLEGSFSTEEVRHSMDHMGIPYSEFGLELSAPSRGAVVWALIREIGREGLRERICRHNDMARWVADFAQHHPRLELVQAPTLSICCFRYINDAATDLNDLNRRVHRALVRHGENIPSTALINGKLAIRPCFIGARTIMQHAHSLVEEVIATGDRLVAESASARPSAR